VTRSGVRNNGMDSRCLDEATVLEFVEGTLNGSRRAVVEAHLATCAACADLVTWAAAGDLAATTLPLGPAPRTRADALAPGLRVGRYQILERIGHGGMGEVYAAYHPDLDRKIALKVVHQAGTETGEREARLPREARSIARLSHPNVVTVHDAGTVADRVYVAMEVVDGLTIDRWLEASPRPYRQVHRDFKPGNVMEIVSSSEIPGGFVVRGGAYYFSAVNARVSNRTAIPRSWRDVNGGLRVCADAP